VQLEQSAQEAGLLTYVVTGSNKQAGIHTVLAIGPGVIKTIDGVTRGLHLLQL
jgi:peptidyl-tRNA hydrolase